MLSSNEIEYMKRDADSIIKLKEDGKMMMATDKKALRITILELEKAKLTAEVLKLTKQLDFVVPVLSESGHCPQQYGAETECSLHMNCLECWKAVLKEVK